MKNYAYISLINDEKYIPGLKALSRGLINVGTLYPLVILIPDDSVELSNKITNLKLANVIVKFMRCPPFPKTTAKQQEHYWYKTLFKLCAAALIEFEKIIVIDLDMLVLKNLDLLFEKKSFTAVASGNSLFSDWKEFNSGLLVLEPNSILFKKLIEISSSVISLKAKLNIAIGDQDVFNSFKNDWPVEKELHLTENYNLIFSYMTQIMKISNFKFSDIYVIHFTGSEKPWMIKKKFFKFHFLIFRLLIKLNFAKLYCLKKYLKYCK